MLPKEFHDKCWEGKEAWERGLCKVCVICSHHPEFVPVVIIHVESSESCGVTEVLCFEPHPQVLGREDKRDGVSSVTPVPNESNILSLDICCQPQHCKKCSHQVCHVHYRRFALHECKSAEYLLIQGLVAEGDTLAHITVYPGLAIEFPIDGCICHDGRLLPKSAP